MKNQHKLDAIKNVTRLEAVLTEARVHLETLSRSFAAAERLLEEVKNMTEFVFIEGATENAKTSK